MRGRKGERFCCRNHDTLVTGRDGTGACRKCRNDQKAAYRQRHGRGRGPGESRVLIDAEPIRAAVLRRLDNLDRQYTTPNGQPNGRRILALTHARRFGLSYGSASQQIERMARGRSQRIEAQTADEWCVTLGTHLALLYPELYRESVSA